MLFREKQEGYVTRKTYYLFGLSKVVHEKLCTTENIVSVNQLMRSVGDGYTYTYTQHTHTYTHTHMIHTHTERHTRDERYGKGRVGDNKNKKTHAVVVNVV